MPTCSRHACALLLISLKQMATKQGQTTLGKEVAVHDIFQKTLDKTGHWLKDIKNECNLADVHQAYTLLRAVLFTIRYHHCSFFLISSHRLPSHQGPGADDGHDPLCGPAADAGARLLLRGLGPVRHA